jgi:hypothetical protein
MTNANKFSHKEYPCIIKKIQEEYKDRITEFNNLPTIEGKLQFMQSFVDKLDPADIQIPPTAFLMACSMAR